MTETDPLSTLALLVVVGFVLVLVALLAFAITRTGVDVKYHVSLSPSTELLTEVVAGCAGLALLVGCAAAASATALGSSQVLGAVVGGAAGLASLAALAHPCRDMYGRLGPVFDERRRRRSRD